MKRKFLSLSIAIAILLLSGFIYFLSVRPQITTDQTFTIKAGSSVYRVARDLGIRNPTIFVLYVRFFGGRVMSGTYDLHGGMGAVALARKFSRGDISTVRITIPEGLTVLQIRELLYNNSNLSGEITTNYNDGELFPDTYFVSPGTSRERVLEIMRKKMADIETGFNESGRPAPSPLTDWNSVITLASIVQKETPMVSEMPIVAGVYLNRLRINMKLQADPTVVYTITEKWGDMRGKPLLRAHLQTASKYNTYLNRGLPPAPIANVGADAIAAVLNPTTTDYLFFVADGRGGHNFSITYEEHQKNHQAWRDIKKLMQ